MSILWISLVSGMSTPLGGWVVTRWRGISQQTLGFFMGLAAGIMLMVVIVELLPASFAATRSTGVFFGGVAVGWLFMWVLRLIVARVMFTNTEVGREQAWLRMGIFIAIAIALHDLPEGLAIGAGNAVHPEIGVIIAVAIAVHNVPEGMSIAMPLLLSGIRRGQVLLWTTLVGLVTPLGTLMAQGLLHVSPQFIALSLAFASGSMAFVVARDILPEAITASVRYTALGVSSGALSMFAVHLLHG